MDRDTEVRIRALEFAIEILPESDGEEVLKLAYIIYTWLK